MPGAFAAVAVGAAAVACAAEEVAAVVVGIHLG